MRRLTVFLLSSLICCTTVEILVLVERKSHAVENENQNHCAIAVQFFRRALRLQSAADLQLRY